MIKKNKDKNLEPMVMSEFIVEASDLQKRYKSLRKTVKNLKKFTEAQIKGRVAEA